MEVNSCIAEEADREIEEYFKVGEETPLANVTPSPASLVVAVAFEGVVKVVCSVLLLLSGVIVGLPAAVVRGIVPVLVEGIVATSGVI